MSIRSKTPLMVALLSVSLTTIILHNSFTRFLQLFIAFILACLLTPAVVFLHSLAVYYRDSEFYRRAL